MREMMRHHAALRATLALLLSLVLLMRIVAPVGFMPVAAGDSISIQVCDGTGLDTRIALDKGKPVEKHDAADKPCAFGFGMAADLTAPLPAPALFLLLAPVDAAGTAFVDRVRRLAAPPPPAIGPPGLR